MIRDELPPWRGGIACLTLALPLVQKKPRERHYGLVPQSSATALCSSTVWAWTILLDWWSTLDMIQVTAPTNLCAMDLVLLLWWSGGWPRRTHGESRQRRLGEVAKSRGTINLLTSSHHQHRPPCFPFHLCSWLRESLMCMSVAVRVRSRVFYDWQY